MKIYLLRHGESSPIGADNERSLSEQGQEDIKRLADFIAPLNLMVSRIIHSEKTRARQTAEILAPAVILEGEMESSPELDPASPLSQIINHLNNCEGDSLLVGHMPYLGRLISQLTSGNENNNIVYFNPGSMVCLEQTHHDRWSILWMLTPLIL